MKKTHFLNKFVALVALFGIFLTFTACNEDNDDDQPQTIAVIAQGNANLTTLVAALQRADLVTVLNNPGTYTVFAPTNAAFSAYLGAGVSINDAPVADLRQILLNHVISTKLNATALPEDGYIKTLTLGSASTTNTLSMYVKKTATEVKLNGIAVVTTANVEASNGIIHLVDKVIGLPTIVTHATANLSFTSLVGALTGVGQPNFVGILSGTGPFTVFAPTNAAFTSLNVELAPGGIAGVSDANLTKVLQYHVINGNVLEAQLPSVVAAGGTVATLNTQNITISLTGGAKVTGTYAPARPASNIIATDVQCVNGVIHVLDKVLLPVL
jgi:uncharacterized surface protein with fasciclin (FAS1) repeats